MSTLQALELARIEIRAKDPRARIALYHPDRGFVDSYSGEGAFEGPPGIYRVESTLFGRTWSALVGFKPGVNEPLEVDSDLSGATIPFPGHPELEGTLELDRCLEEVRKAATKERGQYLLVVEALRGQAATELEFRLSDNTVLEKAKEVSEIPGFRVHWFAPDHPGPWQIEYSVDGFRRAQALALDYGFITEYWLARSSSGGFLQPVLTMSPLDRPLTWDDRLATEATLHELAEGKLLNELPPAAPDPIRDMASSYQVLAACRSQTDGALAGLWAGEASGVTGSLRERWTPVLDQLAGAAHRRMKDLPNSIDFRLIAVAATWERATLQMDVPDTISEGAWVSMVNKAQHVDRRRNWTLVFILAVILVLSANWLFNSFSPPDIGDLTKPESDRSSAVPITIAIVVVTFVIGLVLQIFESRVRVRFQDPPVFAEGMATMLRLAAMYEWLCAKDSRLASIALRQTANALWTTWDASMTDEEGHRRLGEVLTDLEAVLETVSLKPGGCGAVERAAAHLARSLRVPRSLVDKFVVGLTREKVQKLVCLAPGEIAKIARVASTRTRPAADSKPKAKIFGCLFLILVAVIVVSFPKFFNSNQVTFAANPLERRDRPDLPQTGAGAPVGDGVRIAFIGDLSSPAGAEALKGVRLAFGEAYETGGIHGKDIEIIEIEAKGDVAAEARQVVENGAIALLGDLSGEAALKVAEVSYEKGIPFINTGLDNRKMVATGATVFSVGASEDYEAVLLAAHARENRDLKRVGVIYDPSQPRDRQFAVAFERAFASEGRQAVPIRFSQDSDSEVALSRQLSENKVDGVLLAASKERSEAIAKQLRTAGIELPIMGPSRLTGASIAGDSFFSSPFELRDDRSEDKDFLRRWREAEGGRPKTPQSALGFDAGRLLLEAMKKNPGLKPLDIARSIEKTENFRGVTGEIKLDGMSGEPAKSGVIIESKPGSEVQIIPYKAPA